MSEVARETLIERLGVAPDRITTPHFAADPIFRPTDEPEGTTAAAREISAEVGGEFCFLVTHGHTKTRRRRPGATTVTRGLGIDPMVCTDNSKEAHEKVSPRSRTRAWATRCAFGLLPSQRHAGLVRGRGSMVLPSFFEGFGLPLLEAMWCDFPIVCSNMTSLPAITATRPCWPIPPVSRRLAHALTDDDRRGDAANPDRARRQRVKRFSWTKFALEVVAALHQARQRRYR